MTIVYGIKWRPDKHSPWDWDRYGDNKCAQYENINKAYNDYSRLIYEFYVEELPQELIVPDLIKK